MTQVLIQVRQVAARVCRRSGLILLALAGAALLEQGAHAAELDGAWSTRPEECANIFVKRGDQVQLSERADFFGSGFVVNGNMIRGKIATCKVLSNKKTGKKFQLRTTCATDITISNNNFDLELVEPNKVIRSFPGIPEMNTPYYRCPAS